ncbi:unnamed protein product [Arctogadus glacialis]
MKCAVTVTYESVATDVHPSVVRAIDCPLIISRMFSLVVSYSFTILLVIVPREGIVYRGSISRMNSLNPSPCEMLTGLISLQINSVSFLLLSLAAQLADNEMRREAKTMLFLAVLTVALPQPLTVLRTPSNALNGGVRSCCS